MPFNKFPVATKLRVTLFFLVTSVFILSVVYWLANPVLAVKGSYLVGGVLLSSVLLLSERSDVEFNWSVSFRYATKVKVVLLVSCISLFLLVSFQGLVVVHLLLLPVGYISVIYQYLESRRVGPGLLLQMSLLFLITGAAKIFVTDFYIGQLDLILHTLTTNQLVSSGRLGGIQTKYANFPLLHVISGTFHQVTGISVNTSLMVIGVMSFSVAILSIYLLFARHSNQSVAFFGTLLLSVFSTYIFYSLYFFPQSAMMAIVFLVLPLLSTRRLDRRVNFVVVVMLMASIFLHHFSFILLILFTIALLSTQRITERFVELGTGTKWYLVLVSFAGALYYWTISGKGFLISLVVLSREVIFNLSLAFSSGASTRTTFYLGLEQPEQTVLTGVQWLFSLQGVHNMLLVATVIVAINYVLFDDVENDLYPFLFLGAGVAGLFLDTPLAIKSLQRLILIFSPFVALFMSIWYADSICSSDLSRLAVVSLIVLLSITGPLMAHGDVMGYDNQTKPDLQAEFSSEEFSELRSVSGFLRSTDHAEVGAFLTTKELMEYHGFDASGDLFISDQQIRGSRIVVFSRNWPDRGIRHLGTTTYLQNVYVSESYLNSFEERNAIVYDSGTIGLSYRANLTDPS